MATLELEKPKKHRAKTLRREMKFLVSQIDDVGFLQLLIRKTRKRLSDEIEMTPELQAALDEGERDIAAGRVIPHEEVMKRAQVWLDSH